MLALSECINARNIGVPFYQLCLFTKEVGTVKPPPHIMTIILVRMVLFMATSLVSAALAVCFLPFVPIGDGGETGAVAADSTSAMVSLHVHFRSQCLVVVCGTFVLVRVG